MQRILRLLSVALCLPFAETHAQSSQEYAAMGQITWTAFECASLASHLRDPKEQERLFMFGYKQGQAFLGALQGGRITEKDAKAQVPIGLALLIQGPTSEFILGRIFEVAQDAALKKVLRTGTQVNSAEVQQILAKSEYSSKNCQFIGDPK